MALPSFTQFKETFQPKGGALSFADFKAGKKETTLFEKEVPETRREVPILGIGIQPVGMAKTTPAIIEKEPIMRFEVGEGLTPYGKEVAESKLQELSRQAPGMTVKIPFVPKEITVPAVGPEALIAPMIEWPEELAIRMPIKVKRAFEEIVGAKPTAEEIKPKPGSALWKMGIYEITPYSKQVLDLQEQGWDPFSAALYTVSGAIFDVAIVGQILNAGAKGLLKATEKSVSKKLAWDTLGRPATIQEAKKEYLNLAKIFHPDKPTGNEEMFKNVANAWSVIQKKGMPNVTERSLVPKLRQISAAAISDIRAKIPEEVVQYPAIRGLLPGYAEVPGQPRFAPGLTIKKMMPVGRPAEKGIIPQELQPLAQKAKTMPLEDFVEGITHKEVGEYLLSETDLQKIAKASWKDTYKTERQVMERKLKQYGFKSIEDFYTQAVKGVKEVKPEVPVKVLKPDILKEIGKPKTLDEIITAEAKALQEIESGLGVTTMPKPGFEGEQFIRVSEHTQWYKDFWKANKRAPDLADWKERAESELEAGRSAIGLENEFRAIKGAIKEPVEAEIDVESLFRETEEKVMAEVPMERRIRGALVSSEERAEFLKTLSDEIQLKIKRGQGLTLAEAGRVGKIYEDFIRKGKFPERLITMPEEKLLKLKLRAERKGATEGAIAARRATRTEILENLRIERQEIESVKKDIVDYVKENLSPTDRGKAITMVRDARTQRNLIKAFARIENWAEQASKKAVRNDILKITRKALDSPSVALDHKERMAEALSLYELKGHTTATIQKLSSLRKYLEEAEKKGEDVELPMRLYNQLKILNRQPFAEIPLRNLEGLLSEVRKLEDLGRRTWAVKQARYENERQAWKDELMTDIAPIKTIEEIKPAIGENLTFSQKLRNFIIRRQNQANRIDKVISPMDVIFDIADGGRGTYNGAHSLAKRRFDAKFSQFVNLKDELSDSVIELYKQLKLTNSNLERIGIYAANQQGADASRLGYAKAEINTLKLTPDEQKLYELMRQSMDDQFSFVEKLMKEVYNEPVRKVKNYFSFMTDWKAMDELEVFRRIGPGVEEFGKPTKTVEMGFTKTRMPGARQKLKVNALEVYLKHMENVAYMRTMGRDIKIFYEIVNSPEYGEKAGDLLQTLMVEWVDMMARKGGQIGSNQIMVLDILRKNIGAGILGLKLTSALIQPTALIDGMGAIGPEWALRGSINFAKSREWREFLTKFPELRERTGGEHAIRELIEGNRIQRMQAKGFIPLQELDRMTAYSIAAGAYEQKMTELGLPIDLIAEPNVEAMQYAQLVVRRTQASSLFKDVPLAISRGALTGSVSVDRAIFQFQNFLLFRWSRVRHDAIRAGIKTRSPKQVANVLFWIMLASLTATGIRIGTWRIIDMITGKERDEDDQDKFLLRSMLSEFVGMVPFMGNAMGSYMYDSAFLPIMETPEDVVAGFKKTVEGKSPQTKTKGLIQFLTSLGAIAGVPGSFQAAQFLRQVVPEAEKKKKKTPGGVKMLDFGEMKAGVKELSF